jgi:catechol 2,3-dioxygenase-like lactoylglutathione lyase family enzyme
MQRVVPAIPVTDVERARTFYADRLGFEVDWEWCDEPEEPAFLQLSRAGLSIYLSARPDRGPAGGLTYLYVGDVDAWCRELSERGVGGEAPPRDRPWGNREWVVTDPDGNRICFASVLSQLSPDRSG